LQQQKDNHGSGTQDNAAQGVVRDREVIEVKLLVDEPIAAEPAQEINASVSDKPAPEQHLLQEPLHVEPTCDEQTSHEPLLDEQASTRSLLVEQPSHKGQLILDATCAPVDIRYPTDLGLLNDACVKTEQIIDQLHAHAPEGQKKPRTYRESTQKFSACNQTSQKASQSPSQRYLQTVGLPYPKSEKHSSFFSSGIFDGS